jgi:hypothetical protein
MAKRKAETPQAKAGSPEEVLFEYFKYKYPKIADKVQRQVRRSPRRQTGKYKTNRASRWILDSGHPDYTAANQIPKIEAKLFAMALEFNGAPDLPEEVAEAASKVLGKPVTAGAYRCPVSGRSMSFKTLVKEGKEPTHGQSAFHVGHVRPKAMGGVNDPDNTYWTSDLGNRIQGDKTLADTIKIIVEMAEFQRKRENVQWGELVNRYLD